MLKPASFPIIITLLRKSNQLLHICFAETKPISFQLLHICFAETKPISLQIFLELRKLFSHYFMLIHSHLS